MPVVPRNAAIRSAAAPFTCSATQRTRVNWSAPNTSYVERDAENSCAVSTIEQRRSQTTDASGRPMWTIRRDYRDLVPLLRHRYEPEHPAVLALRRRAARRPADDRRRSADSTSPPSSRAREVGAGKAAAVVLDPDTGALLASASYPWPADGWRRATTSEGAIEPLLDRARYGLYPPGSTFKLVTAAAALGRDIKSCQDGVHLLSPARREGWREARRMEPSRS